MNVQLLQNLWQRSSAKLLIDVLPSTKLKKNVSCGNVNHFTSSIKCEFYCYNLTYDTHGGNKKSKDESKCKVVRVLN